jgi:hypothetical protein
MAVLQVGQVVPVTQVTLVLVVMAALQVTQVVPVTQGTLVLVVTAALQVTPVVRATLALTALEVLEVLEAGRATGGHLMAALRFSAATLAPLTALQLLATPAMRVTPGAAVRAVQVGTGAALMLLL